MFNDAVTEPQPGNDVSVARQEDYYTTVYHNLPVKSTWPTPAASQEV